MRIESFAVGPLLGNCYLVYDEVSREGVMIDLGDWDTDLAERVVDLGLHMVGIYLTHGHFDHVDGVNTAHEEWPDAVVYMHSGDQLIIDTQGPLIEDILPGYHYTCPTIDEPLADGQVIRVGALELQVIHTPGHTPGSVCIQCGEVVFSGDTLFAAGIGRTDLAGGNEEALLSSIRDRLLTLPGETIMYPGHGPRSTIAQEARTNPWLQSG
jgi:hydroxyacylglutathione hydrolase